jgi:hypothetical protein
MTKCACCSRTDDAVIRSLIDRSQSRCWRPQLLSFWMPISVSEWDSLFPLVHKELHVTGHGCPAWPIEVNLQTVWTCACFCLLQETSLCMIAGRLHFWILIAVVTLLKLRSMSSVGHREVGRSAPVCGRKMLRAGEVLWHARVYQLL